jgi:hypothetical protein
MKFKNLILDFVNKNIKIQLINNNNILFCLLLISITFTITYLLYILYKD